jgi:hypothetical protein
VLFPRYLLDEKLISTSKEVRIDSADPDGLHSFEKQSDLVATERCAVARRFQPIWTAGRLLRSRVIVRLRAGQDTTTTILLASQILASVLQPINRSIRLALIVLV